MSFFDNLSNIFNPLESIKSIAHLAESISDKFQPINADSDKILSSIANGMNNANPVNFIGNIAEPIMTGGLATISDWASGLWNFIMRYTLVRFGPDMQWFNYYFTAEYAFKMDSFFQNLGALLAAVLFFVSLFLCLLNGLLIQRILH